VASLREIVCRICNSIRDAFIVQPKALDAERMIDECFKYGSQYYVAGRYGVFAGLIPVAGNLHHHAIEMFLKGALSKTMTSEEMRRKLGHRLPKIWKKFKQRACDPSLSRFNRVIKGAK